MWKMIKFPARFLIFHIMRYRRLHSLTLSVLYYQHKPPLLHSLFDMPRHTGGACKSMLPDELAPVPLVPARQQFYRLVYIPAYCRFVMLVKYHLDLVAEISYYIRGQSTRRCSCMVICSSPVTVFTSHKTTSWHTPE